MLSRQLLMLSIFTIMVVSFPCYLYAVDDIRDKEKKSIPITLLEVGPLTPASQDNQTQKQMLTLLATALAQYEKWDEGDISLLMTVWQSESEYQGLYRDILQQMSEVNNMEMQDQEEIPDKIPDLHTFMGPNQYNLRWVYRGYKIRYESHALQKESTVVSKDVEAAFDGEISHIYYPNGLYKLGRREGLIQRGLPTVVQIQTVSTLTLTKIVSMPPSRFVSQPGAKFEGYQVVGGEKCLKVSAPLGKSILVEVWFSPDHGYRVKRVFKSPALGKREDGQDVIIEIKTFKEHQKQWFPAEGTYISMFPTKDNPTLWLTAKEWRLVSYSDHAADYLFSVESTPADHLFPIQVFPTGTYVFDTVRGISYIAGQDNAIEDNTRSVK